MPSRRDMLRCFTAYVVTVGSASFGAVLGQGSAFKRRSLDIQNITFDGRPTDIPFCAGACERFVLFGLLVFDTGGFYGDVTVTFADTTAATIRCAANNFASSYRESTVCLQAGKNDLRINGKTATLRSTLERLIAENDFNGIGSLSDQSRAVVALNALGNSDAFFNLMTSQGSESGRALRKLSPAPSIADRWWRAAQLK